MKTKRVIILLALIVTALTAVLLNHIIAARRVNKEPVFETLHLEENAEAIQKEQEQINFAPDAPKEFEAFRNGLIGIGDSFEQNFTKLYVTINSVSLSNNVFNAGWSVDSFDPYANVTVNDDQGNSHDLRVLDAINYDTGELISGLSLVTVDVTVANHNTETTNFGRSENDFGSCVLYLVSAKVWDDGGLHPNNIQIPVRNNVACSYKSTWEQSAWLNIKPGDTVQYKLAFVTDDFVTLDDAFLSSYVGLLDGACYLPLSLADIA